MKNKMIGIVFGFLSIALIWIAFYIGQLFDIRTIQWYYFPYTVTAMALELVFMGLSFYFFIEA